MALRFLIPSHGDRNSDGFFNKMQKEDEFVWSIVYNC